MLDELEPSQFEELIAATIVGCNPDAYKLMAYLAEAICNKINIVLAATTGIEPDLHEPADFLPLLYQKVLMPRRDRRRELEEADQKRMDAAAATARALYGRP